MAYINEYDAFGPWIYEIDEEHEVPKIFTNYYNESGIPLILFKVPRNIDRRTASPYIDLYDYLVGAYDKYLLIFKRTGRKAMQQRIYYNDITAIKDIHALLKGELILFKKDGTEVIEYNTVSEEIILKFINIIENKICIDAQRIRMESIPAGYSADERSIDILFFNLFNKLQAVNNGLSLIAYQPAAYIKKDRALRQNLKERRLALSKTAFMINDKELIILERSLPLRKHQKANYVYSYLYIPFQNITGSALKDFDKQRYLSILELKVKNQTFSYIFENRNNKMIELYHKLHDFNRIV